MVDETKRNLFELQMAKQKKLNEKIEGLNQCVQELRRYFVTSAVIGL